VTGVKEKEGTIFTEIQERVEKFESEEFPGEFETDVLAFSDPRSQLNGVRLLCNEESLELDSGVKKFEGPERYNLIRYMLGIPEGNAELRGVLPLNYCQHFLNGVSFDKGCYIGQELTQRTHFTGVLRRICMPFMVVD